MALDALKEVLLFQRHAQVQREKVAEMAASMKRGGSRYPHQMTINGAKKSNINRGANKLQECVKKEPEANEINENGCKASEHVRSCDMQNEIIHQCKGNEENGPLDVKAGGVSHNLSKGLHDKKIDHLISRQYSGEKRRILGISVKEEVSSDDEVVDVYPMGIEIARMAKHGELGDQNHHNRGVNDLDERRLVGRQNNITFDNQKVNLSSFARLSKKQFTKWSGDYRGDRNQPKDAGKERTFGEDSQVVSAPSFKTLSDKDTVGEPLDFEDVVYVKDEFSLDPKVDSSILQKRKDKTAPNSKRYNRIGAAAMNNFACQVGSDDDDGGEVLSAHQNF